MGVFGFAFLLSQVYIVVWCVFFVFCCCVFYSYSTHIYYRRNCLCRSSIWRVWKFAAGRVSNRRWPGRKRSPAGHNVGENRERPNPEPPQLEEAKKAKKRKRRQEERGRRDRRISEGGRGKEVMDRKEKVEGRKGGKGRGRGRRQKGRQNRKQKRS